MENSSPKAYFSQKRVTLTVLTMVIAVSALCYKAYVTTLGIDVETRTNLMILARTPQSLISLKEQSKELDLLASNIEKNSFEDIKKNIDRTIYLINSTTKEIEAQYKSWENVKEQMNVDSSKLIILKQNLDNIQSAQTEEIAKLKAILNTAYTESAIDKSVGYIVSFVIGVLSSLIATIIFPTMKSKVIKTVEWISKP